MSDFFSFLSCDERSKYEKIINYCEKLIDRNSFLEKENIHLRLVNEQVIIEFWESWIKRIRNSSYNWKEVCLNYHEFITNLAKHKGLEYSLDVIRTKQGKQFYNKRGVVAP